MTHVAEKKSARQALISQAFFAAAVVGGPALLLWHLHGQWNPDGEYAYAWVVPLLAAFLCKSRWDDRPLPSASVKHALFAALGFALFMPPTRWLLEAAPERGVCDWSYATACLGISLSLILLAGGSAWLRWFSFPFLFLLTTVPWPHSLEQILSNPLMRGTAGATVEILCLMGIPSVQTGNLVHIETGVLDIAEACSGIRSLQAMVMISLFLGELFRLRPVRRFLLIAAGLAFTLLANVIRTAVLAGVGFKHGMKAVDDYHDAAGFAVLALSLVGTLGLAFMLRTEKSRTPHLAPPATGLALPLKLCSGLLLWFLVGEIAVEAWYRLHESAWQGWSWSVEWPGHVEDFHFTEIPRHSIRNLMCDEAHAASWRGSDGSDWSLYWLRWNPGNVAAEAAKAHRPDVCLTAEGAALERNLGLHYISAGGRQIPFQGYSFRSGDKIRYVYFCNSEERSGAAAIGWNRQFEALSLMQRACRGWRHSGEQSLELAVSGYLSESNAQQALKSQIEQLMQFNRSTRSMPEN